MSIPRLRLSFEYESVADLVGIVGSLVCAIHCVAAPILIVLGSTVPTILMPDETFHQAMLWLVVPAALLAFGLGCRKHKDMMTIALGGTGIFGMIASTLVLHDLVGESGERLAVLVSTALLVIAHIRNFTCCRHHSCHFNHK